MFICYIIYMEIITLKLKSGKSLVNENLNLYIKFLGRGADRGDY